MQPDVNDMFGPSGNVSQSIKELAESIVLTESQIDELKSDVTDKRQQLIALMQQSGTESVKLESGLAPKLENKQRYGKKKTVEDSVFFKWLGDNDLADIIRPTVHHGTLNTALDEFCLQGGDLPEDIFNSFEQPSIRMNGRSKFLASQ